MADDLGEAAMMEPRQDEEDDDFLDGKHAGRLSHADRNASGVEILSGPISTTPAITANARNVSKELLQVEVELRLLEALEIYHPAKLQGIHRHFILYGLMEYLERRLNHHFSAEEILELLDRFYNLELLDM